MTLAIALAYLIGSIPFALIMARRLGADLRRTGSGNLGAANVVRASGWVAGLLVAALDVAKGALSVMIAARFSDHSSGPAIAGVAAIVGHIYPVWLRFRGGVPCRPEVGRDSSGVGRGSGRQPRRPPRRLERDSRWHTPPAGAPA